MFFTHQQYSQKQGKDAEIRQVNADLHCMIDSYFEIHYEEMKQKAIIGGISPEKVSNFLQELKLDTQKKAVCRVREIAQQLAEESHLISKNSVETACHQV
jgi:ubiquinone biosynthesis protein UbiJ